VESKIFFDSNIVLDILDRKRGNYDKVSKVLEWVETQGWRIVISEDMLTTIYYIFSKKEDLLHFFQIVEEEWEILCFDREVRKKAYEMALESGGDFEDIIQCIAAKEAGCEALLTLDRTFYDCGLKIVGYEEILRW